MCCMMPLSTANLLLIGSSEMTVGCDFLIETHILNSSAVVFTLNSSRSGTFRERPPILYPAFTMLNRVGLRQSPCRIPK